jgi:hypothetical protein
MRFSLAFLPTADPAAADYPLQFDPRLVEDAVLLAIEEATVETRRRFRRERDPLYEIGDPERKESSFQEVHGRWFVILGLAAPVRRVLARHPSIAEGTSRCLVLPVLRAREEYADLQSDQRDEPQPVLLLRLRVTTLVDRDRLLPLLHHELLHIADMLDPEFGFEPWIGGREEGPTMENLLRERYRALWDVTIDGRLAAAGELPPNRKDLRRRDFLNAFPMLGEASESLFERFFDGPRPTHAELAAFAATPVPVGGNRAVGRCSLCRMPSARLHSNPTRLEPQVQKAIRHDFPDWRPDRGLCLQCADLYAAVAVDSSPG